MSKMFSKFQEHMNQKGTELDQNLFFILVALLLEAFSIC